MRNRLGMILVAVGLMFLAPSIATAQPPGPPDDGPPPPDGRGRGRQGGDDDRPQPPPPPFGGAASALMSALDTDRDGELSESEIKNAAESLKKLDNNQDGVIDRSELRPRPARGTGREGGPRGARLGRRPPHEDGPPDGPQAANGRRRGPGRSDRSAPAIRIGRVLPPRAEHELGLDAKQLEQIDELESTVARKLESILRPEQTRKLQQLIERHRPDGPPGDEAEEPGPPPPPRRQ